MVDPDNTSQAELSTTPKNDKTANTKSTKTTEQSDKFQKLNLLKELYDQGLITVVEFKERKSQIIDDLTGTTTTTQSTAASSRSRHSSNVRRSRMCFTTITEHETRL